MWHAHKIKILSLALLVSVALNIGLISWMAGTRMGEFGRPPHGPDRFARIEQALPPDRREALLDSVKTQRQDFRQALEAMREQRQVVRTLLAQERIDPAALEAAFAESRRRGERLQALGHGIAVRLMPEIPYEKRREMADKKQRMF